VTCFSRGALLLAVVVLTAAPASIALSAGEIYLHDDTVANEIDIERFVRTGEIVMVSGEPAVTTGDPLPVPDTYQPLRILQPGFEQLGTSPAAADGIRFIANGQVWKKNHLVVVAWKIRIPDTSQRATSDFDDPLTVSLWVDWDRSGSWDGNELVIRRDVDVTSRTLDRREPVTLFFVTAFRVPDIPPDSRTTSDHGHGGGVVPLWVRGTVAYADSRPGPAGDQLFGDVEDYRVNYEIRRDRKGD
jgi:hypothetical protein